MKSQQSLWATQLRVSLGGAMFLAASSLFSQEAGLDDFTTRSIVQERQTLPYQPIREADILWEKRISRVIDVREKMNLPFASPNQSLFNTLQNAIEKEEIVAYSTDDDKFSRVMSRDEVFGKFSKRDTIVTFNLDTGEEELKIVINQMNWEDVKRFRLKEAWFFDRETSTLQVRILGIAPLLDIKDENGDFKYELPLFWVHYPSARQALAQYKVSTNEGNLAASTTWEDLFERRHFASSITKENNVHDMRLQDMYTGLDILTQGQKISDGMFNFEHDMWSW